MNEIRNHQHYEECKSLLQRSLEAEAKENFEAFADNCYCEFCNKYFA